MIVLKLFSSGIVSVERLAGGERRGSDATAYVMAGANAKEQVTLSITEEINNTRGQQEIT